MPPPHYSHRQDYSRLAVRELRRYSDQWSPWPLFSPHPPLRCNLLIGGMPMSLSREQDTTLHRLFATLLIPLALVLVTIPAQAQRFPTTEELKAEVATEVASLQKLSQEIVDMVFSFSELGFQEFWTLDYLTGIQIGRASCRERVRGEVMTESVPDSMLKTI